MRLYGNITTAEARNTRELLFEDFNFDTLKYSIWDCSDLESLTVAAEKDLLKSAAVLKAVSSYKPSLKYACISHDSMIREVITGYIEKSRSPLGISTI